jgi:tetratricopeptide (TPR) repeat protein
MPGGAPRRAPCPGRRLRARDHLHGRQVGASRARALRIQACADTTALRAPIRPPSDEPTRARVEALRSVLAKAKAEQRAGNYANALALATTSADEAVSLGYRPVEAEALYLLADVQDDEGDYPLSERTFRRSFAASLAGRHEAQAARSLSALVVEVGLRQARFAEAHDWAALAEAETERSSDPFIKGELARNEGRLLVREDRYEEARVAIEKCLAIWEPALGPDDYAIAGPVTDLGNVFLLEGRPDEARAEYSRSIAILEKVLGPDSPSLAPNLNNLGELSIGRGDYDLAAQSLERARALWQRALGPDHPKVALALYNLAVTRLGLGDAAGALVLSERALAIWRKALAPDHPDVAMGMHGVAEGLRAKGDFAGALAQEEGSARDGRATAGPGGRSARRGARIDRRAAPGGGPSASAGGGSSGSCAAPAREREGERARARRGAFRPREGPCPERSGAQPRARGAGARGLRKGHVTASRASGRRGRSMAREHAAVTEVASIGSAIHRRRAPSR